MRTVLTSTLVLLILASSGFSTLGPRSVTERTPMACCQKSVNGTGCDRASTPMPCCAIRPAPAPIADVPPSSPRAETLPQAYLHPSPQTLTAFQASDPATVHPHDLSARIDSLRLYQLHSVYLI